MHPETLSFSALIISVTLGTVPVQPTPHLCQPNYLQGYIIKQVGKDHPRMC